MDLSEKNVLNARINERMNECKYEPPYKLSDFSIDHILNKAGSSVQKQSYNEIYHGNGADFYYKYANDRLGEEYSDCSPILNWLQYTRYQPPRLPSKCHVLRLKY